MPIVTLGITGHRYLTEMHKVTAGVERTLEHIREFFPATNFRILSSLAEGADRILVKRILMIPGSFLWVPLPLPEEEYLLDFESVELKDEFFDLLGKAKTVVHLPVTDDREEAYLAAGKFVIENSDMLVAIWDGKPAQGIAGTAEIVALARERRLPLAWIHAGNHHPGTDIPTSLGPGQGKVTFENFPTLIRKI